MTFKFELGWIVKDKISGMKGVVTSRTDYLNKCVRYGITKTGTDKEGKPFEAAWFDEDQLELVKKTDSYKPTKDYTGGPARAVPPMNNPK
jgi:hypothetical protein